MADTRRAGFQKVRLGELKDKMGPTKATMSRIYYGQSTKKSMINISMRLNPFTSIKAPSTISIHKKIGVEDMTKMDNLTGESLLSNLDLRYREDLIYTRVHTILVAINPFKQLPLYSAHVVKAYAGKTYDSMPPHIFGLVEQAYSNMTKQNKNQSLIVSGESGAGKSETCRLALQFLSGRSDSSTVPGTVNIETMILETVPVLEALGNAKTVRNNNSSRFGKYIELQFNKNAMCGAKITSYLLEKSRVIYQAESERNYHIFYQLTEGSTPDEKAKYKLNSANAFSYLNQSGCVSIPEVDEQEEWKQFKQGLTVLQIVQEQHSVFSILAGILHLGNIKISTAGDKANIDSNDIALQNAAQLLGLQVEQLKLGLLQKTSMMGRDKVTIKMNVEQSVATRDALSKILYSRLFDWLIEKMNKLINQPQSNLYMGILDIFGFENFKRNSFEQFCINFTNERLQFYFNHHIFKMEQEEYDKEKIDWSSIDFKDNQPCLDLIEGMKPPGIIPLLNEESNFPKASDQTFLTKVHTSFQASACYVKQSVKEKRPMFGVKHYAGDVMYEVAGFLEKNRDAVPDDFPEMFGKNKDPLLVELFRIKEESSEGPGKGKRGARGKATVGTIFRQQLESLMNMLGKTNPFFVRCIKPNASKTPNNFDPQYIQEQLAYSGMYETIRIRRLGYPQRCLADEFVGRYRCLDPANSSDAKTLINALRSKLPDPKGVQVGLTKVFMRYAEYLELEKGRGDALKGHALKVQTWWRMCMNKAGLKRKQSSIAAVGQAIEKFRIYKTVELLNAAVLKKLALEDTARKSAEEKRKQEAIEAAKKAEEAKKAADQAEAARKAAEVEAKRQQEAEEARRRAQELQKAEALRKAAEDEAAHRKEAELVKKIEGLKQKINQKQNEVQVVEKQMGSREEATVRRRKREDEYFQDLVWTVMDGLSSNEIVNRALSKDEMLVEAALAGFYAEKEAKDPKPRRRKNTIKSKTKVDSSKLVTDMMKQSAQSQVSLPVPAARGLEAPGSRSLFKNDMLNDDDFKEMEKEFYGDAKEENKGGLSKYVKQSVAPPQPPQNIQGEQKLQQQAIQSDPNHHLNFYDLDEFIQTAIRQAGGKIVPPLVLDDELDYNDYIDIIEANNDHEKDSASNPKTVPLPLDPLTLDAVICEALHAIGVKPQELGGEKSGAPQITGAMTDTLKNQGEAMQKEANAMHQAILKEAGFC